MITNLTLDQLQVLVSIVDHGSFTAASRELRRAQSSISQAISNLEALQGVVLFDRSGHKPVLTASGRVLVDEARVVLKSVSRFRSLAATVSEGIEPELSIAIDPVVPTEICVASLNAFTAEFPDVAIRFHTEGLGGAERRLRRGDVALAFCTLLPSIPQDFVALPLTSFDMVPVVSSQHRIADHEGQIPMSEIECHIQLILSDPQDIESQGYGILSNRRWRFVELSRRLDFLLSGFGWCRMPEYMIAPYVQSGKLKVLQIEDDPNRHQPPLTIYAAHARDRSLGKAAQWLMNDIKSKFE